MKRQISLFIVAMLVIFMPFQVNAFNVTKVGKLPNSLNKIIYSNGTFYMLVSWKKIVAKSENWTMKYSFDIPQGERVNDRSLKANNKGELFFATDKNIYALTPDGKIKWKKPEKNTIIYCLSNKNGEFYVTAGGEWEEDPDDPESGYLVNQNVKAYDFDGNVAWTKKKKGGNLRIEAKPNGNVVLYYDRAIIILNNKGQIINNLNIPCNSVMYSTILNDKLICVSGNNFNDFFTLYAYNFSGNKIFAKEIDGYYSSLSDYNGNLTLFSKMSFESGNLFLFDYNGNIIKKLEHIKPLSMGPYIYKGNIFYRAIDENSSLVSIDKNYKILEIATKADNIMVGDKLFFTSYKSDGQYLFSVN